MSVIAADATATITNLLTAYEGEVNAHSRYLAFATRADGDGFPGVASLFRAASRAEQIHANNHARVIRELGGQIKCEIQTIEIETTLENLKAALAGETYEASQMYPGFLEEARAHRITDAIRTLNRALESERVHARLYGQAIGELKAGRPIHGSRRNGVSTFARSVATRRTSPWSTNAVRYANVPGNGLRRSSRFRNSLELGLEYRLRLLALRSGRRRR